MLLGRKMMYSSEGNIIAFSDKGLEKKEKTNILVFPEGTKSINGNYSLSHSNDELRYKREFGLVITSSNK